MRGVNIIKKNINKFNKTIALIITTIFVPIVAIKIFLSYWWFQIWMGGFLFDMSKWEYGDIMMYGLVTVMVSTVILIFGILEIFPDIKQN